MNTRSPLFKYQIGLILLGIATFALIVFLIVQGNLSRQDIKTHEAAVEAASELNGYVDSKGQIPESLDEADVESVPETITYEKLSEEQYRFCATYKGNSTVTAADALSGYYGSPSDYNNDTYLYIPSSYKKGENCYTITPYFYNYNYESTLDDQKSLNQSSDTSLQNSGDGPYYACGQSYNYFLPSQVVETIQTDPSRTLTTVGPPTLSFQLSSTLKVFDYNCNEIALSTLSSGSLVALYFNPYGSPITMIIVDNR